MDRHAVKYKNIASVIVILMLLLAIPGGVWPYGYYVLLRWLVTAIAIFILWIAYKSKKQRWLWLMGGIAILFNPIVPIYLDKGIWAVIDFIVAVVFLVSIFKIKNCQIKNQ